jgi:hypothetical protein
MRPTLFSSSLRMTARSRIQIATGIDCLHWWSAVSAIAEMFLRLRNDG